MKKSISKKGQPVFLLIFILSAHLVTGVPPRILTIGEVRLDGKTNARQICERYCSVYGRRMYCISKQSATRWFYFCSNVQLPPQFSPWHGTATKKTFQCIRQINKFIRKNCLNDCQTGLHAALIEGIAASA